MRATCTCVTSRTDTRVISDEVLTCGTMLTGVGWTLIYLLATPTTLKASCTLAVIPTPSHISSLVNATYTFSKRTHTIRSFTQTSHRAATQYTLSIKLQTVLVVSVQTCWCHQYTVHRWGKGHWRTRWCLTHTCSRNSLWDTSTWSHWQGCDKHLRADMENWYTRLCLFDTEYLHIHPFTCITPTIYLQLWKLGKYVLGKCQSMTNLYSQADKYSGSCWYRLHIVPRLNKVDWHTRRYCVHSWTLFTSYYV